MKMQGGGVGYYPRSGSPFVHTDTGSVRAWPRMSREQLIALFPNGNTLHLPADGKPLPGYEQALARRKAGGATALAYLETDDADDAADRTGTEGNGNWLKRVFRGDGQDDATGNADADEETPAPDARAGPARCGRCDRRCNRRGERCAPAARASWQRGIRVPEETGTVVASADDATRSTSFVAARASAVSFAPTTSAFAPPRSAARRSGGGRDRDAARARRRGRRQAPNGPMELAYAPQPTRSEISEADRAILAAFAARRRLRRGAPADAALVVAATRRAGGGGARPIDAASVSTNAAGGIVLVAADLPGYDDDEDALLDLIDGASAPDPKSRNSRCRSRERLPTSLLRAGRRLRC